MIFLPQSSVTSVRAPQQSCRRKGNNEWTTCCRRRQRLNLSKELQTHKCVGHDEMRPWGLRGLVDEMSKPLSIIFEELWRSGEVPSDWKRSSVGQSVVLKALLPLRQQQALYRHGQNHCHSVLQLICGGDNTMGRSINGGTLQTQKSINTPDNTNKKRVSCSDALDPKKQPLSCRGPGNVLHVPLSDSAEIPILQHI